MSTPPAHTAGRALRGKPCCSDLDMEYLLYVPIFTDLNSLIVHNAYISSPLNPLQINESFGLIPSYSCGDSQLPGQRRETETTSLRLHRPGHPPPYAALTHQTSDMTQLSCCKRTILAGNNMAPSLCRALKNRFCQSTQHSG